MHPVAWLLASVLVMADALSPELEIRAAGGEVTIHAQNLPLSQILDRLSSATGMKLTYEGARPTMPVTVSVDGISEAEAIVKLMEGLGVSYVFRTDATGQRVDLLIVTGAGAGALVAAGKPSGSAEKSSEEPVPDYGHIPVDPGGTEEAAEQEKPDANSPYLMLPVPPPPGDKTGSSDGTGVPNMPPAPAFPQGISYPPMR
jgi:hypothetical protein